MVNAPRIVSAAKAGITLGICLLGLASPTRAISTSDKPAAILVWPKIVVDTSALIESRSTDTIIQLGNALHNAGLKQAHCFYVDANSHCSETAAQPGKVCRDSSQCPLPGSVCAGGSTPGVPCDPTNTDACPNGACISLGNANCVAGWSEVDFEVLVTHDQPLVWKASEGLQRGKFPLNDAGVCVGGSSPGGACDPRSSIPTCGTGTCQAADSNAGSGIPPVAEDPFVGTLKCIQYDPKSNPPAPDQNPDPTVGANKLMGTASIEACSSLGCSEGTVDVERYNATGVQFKAVDNSHPGEVHLDGVQYQACPSTLILDNIFDHAPDPLSTVDDPEVLTDLTLVPCGDDFLRQDPGNATAQFLVFNEFEQRLSTSRKVDCFLERQLSLIDTSNSQRSIFSFSVQGTLVGQTRIRGVGSAATGHGLLGVARSSIGGVAGAAYNLQQGFGNSGIDIITIP